MTLRVQIVVVLLAALCTGCFPALCTLRPGVSGTVVDARTGTPLEGAKATVEEKTGTPGKGSATTTVNGSLSIPARRGLGIWGISQDDIYTGYYTLSVERAGYESFTTNFTHQLFWASPVQNFGEIRLQSPSR